jgi:hypothetical protein
VDPLRLEQVLTNLLSSAIKCAAGATVRLAVRDRGLGIPEEHRAAAFPPEAALLTSFVGVVDGHSGTRVLPSSSSAPWSRPAVVSGVRGPSGPPRRPGAPRIHRHGHDRRVLPALYAAPGAPSSRARCAGERRRAAAATFSSTWATARVALLEGHLRGQGPPALLLAGQPGIGKPRLLHAALPRAAGQGLCVLEGGCQDA